MGRRSFSGGRAASRRCRADVGLDDTGSFATGDERRPGVRRGDPLSPLLRGDLAMGGKKGERREAERERKSVGPGPFPALSSIQIQMIKMIKNKQK